MNADLETALRQCRQSIQGEHPWIPGGVFKLSDELAPTLTLLIDEYLSAMHMGDLLADAGVTSVNDEPLSPGVKSVSFANGDIIERYSLDDPELSFDEAEAAGFDGTGRDGDPRFPYHRSDVINKQ